VFFVKIAFFVFILRILPFFQKIPFNNDIFFLTLFDHKQIFVKKNRIFCFFCGFNRKFFNIFLIFVKQKFICAKKVVKKDVILKGIF